MSTRIEVLSLPVCSTGQPLSGFVLAGKTVREKKKNKHVSQSITPRKNGKNGTSLLLAAKQWLLDAPRIFTEEKKKCGFLENHTVVMSTPLLLSIERASAFLFFSL